jgi:predicted ATPase
MTRRLAVVLWFLGYPDQAVQTNQEALAKARKLSHPNSLGYVLTWTSWLYHLSWDVKATLVQTDKAITFCEEENLAFWLPINMILNGWAKAKQNEPSKGLSLLHQGLSDFQANNPTFVVPYFQALLAEMLADSGNVDEALTLLLSSIESAEQIGERWCLPEMQRMYGELLLTSGAGLALIEDSFLRAIELAQEQQSRAIELRATTELCQLWQKQGKHHEALQLLKEIYNWYSEGFEREDLKKAKRVLDSLS